MLTVGMLFLTEWSLLAVLREAAVSGKYVLRCCLNTDKNEVASLSRQELTDCH